MNTDVFAGTTSSPSPNSAANQLPQPRGILVAIPTGALLGLLAWIIYGTVEAIFAYVIPTVESPEIEVVTWQWRFLALFFLIYVVAGILAGAAGGALVAISGRGPVQRSKIEIAAILPLVVAFGVNLMVSGSLGRSEWFTLALAALVCFALIAGLFSETWRGRGRWFTNPWTTTLMLFAMPWVTLEALRYASTLSKSLWSLAAFAGVCVIAAVVERFRPASIALRFAGAIAVLAILVTAGLIHGSERPAFAAPAVSAGAGKPNIILISLDTVRADHLSVYGYARETTPTLRAFAAQATLFPHAIAAADITLSSHASMFTGVYPSWHGAYPVMPDFAYGRPLGESNTLAKMLDAHGYATAGIVANHAFLQVPMGLSQGFGVWDHRVPQRLSSGRLPFYLREGARSLLSLVMDTAAIDGYYLRAADINRQAEELLSSAHPRTPFFLFLNYMDAHSPYVPPAPFEDRFPGRDPHFRPTAHEALTMQINQHEAHATAAQQRDLISQYDGGIAYLDSQLSVLFDWLRGAGLYDNSLIIITSDHGEFFGERDLMQHADGFVYQAQVHVPLLIKYPGQHDAKRYDAWASHVDLMPTILRAAGFDAPPDLPGRDLALPEDPARVVYSEGRLLGDDLTFRLRGVRRAIFSGSSKLIQWTLGAPEFYDLSTDPDETHNSYASRGAEVENLMDRMNRWIASIPHSLPHADELNRGTIERIRSLGYAQ